MNSTITKKFIGNRIRAARENAGLSQAELGREFGWSQSNISDIERGITGIEAIDLFRMAAVLGRPLSYFLGSETNAERLESRLRQVASELEQARKHLQEVVPYAGEWVWLPLIGTVPGRYPEWQEEHEAEEFYPCSVEQIKKRDGAYALRVKGDSMMERRILDGDIIFVDAKRQAQPGDVVLARKDEEVALRIYKEDAKGPFLKEGNQGYPILRLKDARVLGVVVGSYRGKP